MRIINSGAGVGGLAAAQGLVMIGRGPLLRLLVHGIGGHVRERRETGPFRPGFAERLGGARHPTAAAVALAGWTDPLA